MNAVIDEYRVIAYNTARTSDNKIHDDAVARTYGFGGGLVPGVDVYAYMTQPAVKRWGLDWLSRGLAEAKFLKPVYDGKEAIVQATQEKAADGGDWLAVTVTSGGVLCATGRFGLPGVVADDMVDITLDAAPLPVDRPPASAESLPIGALLGTYVARFDDSVAPVYLEDVRETLPLYGGDGLAHPGYVARFGNWALRENVVLGPWIHVASEIRNIRAIAIDSDLAARARVADGYERKGHKFTVLDVQLLANDQPAAEIRHTAIYEPRRRAG